MTHLFVLDFAKVPRQMLSHCTVYYSNIISLARALKRSREEKVNIIVYRPGAGCTLAISGHGVQGNNGPIMAVSSCLDPSTIAHMTIHEGQQALSTTRSSLCAGPHTTNGHLPCSSIRSLSWRALHALRPRPLCDHPYRAASLGAPPGRSNPLVGI
jgi:hypothetical protein